MEGQDLLTEESPYPVSWEQPWGDLDLIFAHARQAGGRRAVWRQRMPYGTSLKKNLPSEVASS